jgi:hypothetical protein
LAIELSLFRLDAENEEFDWEWIDKRRDRTLTAEAVLRLLLGVAHMGISKETQPSRSADDASRDAGSSRPHANWITRRGTRLSRNVTTCFSGNPHAFEGLASLVAERVIGLWMSARLDNEALGRRRS